MAARGRRAAARRRRRVTPAPSTARGPRAAGGHPTPDPRPRPAAADGAHALGPPPPGPADLQAVGQGDRDGDRQAPWRQAGHQDRRPLAWPPARAPSAPRASAPAATTSPSGPRRRRRRGHPAPHADGPRALRPVAHALRWVGPRACPTTTSPTTPRIPASRRRGPAATRRARPAAPRARSDARRAGQGQLRGRGAEPFDRQRGRSRALHREPGRGRLSAPRGRWRRDLPPRLERCARAHLRQGRLRPARRVELAAAGGERPIKGDAVAQAQGIPPKFLENILADLRQSGLVPQPARLRGRLLARPARPRRSPSPTSCAPSTARWPPSAASGPRTSTTPARPSRCSGSGSPSRHNLRAVVENVTVADLAAGKLPDADRARWPTTPRPGSRR